MRAIVVLAIGCLAFWLPAGNAENPAASQKTKTPTDVQSEPVSFGDGNYLLAVRNQGGLVLRHVAKDKSSSEWAIKTRLGASTDDLQVGRITELALARWSNNRLVAIVKVSRDAVATFWTLKFTDLEKQLTDRKEVTCYSALLWEGTRDNQIIAISRSRQGASVSAVIGHLNEGADFASGMIVFDGCPLDMTTVGEVGRFKIGNPPELNQQDRRQQDE